MDREKRLRRVALLCCYFARNCAYYRAGWDGKQAKATNEFWATVQGNFIDIVVLEWLKLFGDHNDKHHWKKVVEDKEDFKQEMLDSCAITEDDLAQSRESFKIYRDKFVAHLYSEDTIHIPVLDTPLALAKHYYKYVAKEIGDAGLRNLPRDIEQYYHDCFQVSEAHFGK
jgi:hypothetical protein